MIPLCARVRLHVRTYLCQRSALPHPAAAAQALSVCATHQIRDLRVEPEVTRRPLLHRNRCSGGSEGCHNNRSLRGGIGDEEEVEKKETEEVTRRGWRAQQLGLTGRWEGIVMGDNDAE